MNDDSELEPAPQGGETDAGSNSQMPSMKPKSSVPIDHNGAVRARYLSSHELGEYAESTAGDAPMVLPSFVPFVLKDRLAANEAAILDAFRSTVAANDAGEMITPAAEWLLDNHYLVEENIRQVRRALPIRFFRELPTVSVAGEDGVATTMPRVVALAWTYVAHRHSTVTPKSLSAFIDGFQRAQTLKIGELWAFPSVIRYVLIENLRRISERMVDSRKMRTRANELADRLNDHDDRKDPSALLDGFTQDAQDNSFAAQMLYRLRDGSLGAGRAINWLEDLLEERESDAEEVLVAEHNRLSSGNVTIGNIMRALRKIDDIDWTEWFEETSAVDRVLRAATDFATLDFHSRDSYRDRIEQLARRSGASEISVAERAVEMAADDDRADTNGDVGFFLIGSRKRELEKALGYNRKWRERTFSGYSKLGWLGVVLPMVLGTIAAVALGVWILSGSGLSTPWIVLLLVLASFPAMEAANSLFHYVASIFVVPTRFPGYEWKAGIPEDARTLVAIPSMLTSRDGIDELVHNLEVHYLSNPQGAVSFALVSDFADASAEDMPNDGDLLMYAREQIDILAQRYAHDGGRRFFLLHRRRLLNEADGTWMGWERKRGKLHELNKLLRGDRDTSFFPPDNPLPNHIKYVMTLDSDTRLTRDVVTRLAGKMHHPVNRPATDPETGLVVDGHAIFQPRVTPSLTTGADASIFQRVFSANRGLDPYVFAVSDTYQDLFDEGTFTGKGLYDIDAFESAIAGRIPENAVLSHDLLEGTFARAGLVTDAELIEDFPTRYEVETSRQHRWVRGDWQLLPYIFGKLEFGLGHGIGGLGRFKMIDNLRRSLTPVFWLAASVIGWCLLPTREAWLWQAAGVLSLFVAPSLSLLRDIFPRGRDVVKRVHFNTFGNDLLMASAQVALRITFIAHNAWLMVDAIARTIYRLAVSRRDLLEWRTAAQVAKTATGTHEFYWRAMIASPVIGVAAFAIALASGASLLSPVSLFSTLWVLAPLVAWVVSRSSETEDRLEVADSDRDTLRRIARRTWRYFEVFVNDEHNQLPPDNVQISPELKVAPRTSPTNIGLYLLSTISARDFGWISFSDTIARLERTITTLEGMEKHRGHLFNWYDTQRLEPLFPRYVSAVDSGNLAGHLIAVASTCRTWAQAPMVHRMTPVDGAIDVVQIAREHLVALPSGWRSLEPLKQRLAEQFDGFERVARRMADEPETAALRAADLPVLADDIARLASDLVAAHDAPASRDLAEWCGLLVETCRNRMMDRDAQLESSRDQAEHLERLGERARALAFEMDFAFLYNKDRRLLSIGCRPDEDEMDESCYDLLASEARLTSLFGIAKGDLPNEHWFRLGRPVVPVGMRGALLSWSGSMFEYLMPPLVMHERLGGILNQTNNLIVEAQIAYGRELGIPWGISESAYNARDPELTYQYSNFGVPSLGLKRGLSHDAVVAPYASLLASQYKPREAVENLARFEKIGALGRYGFFDAVDFTPTRVPAGSRHAVVQNFMAHHHGMSIVAVANVVFEGSMRERFHADPTIEAAELLLQEKAPREISVLSAKDETRAPPDESAPLRQSAMRLVEEPATADRETCILSNGHFSTILTATGSGGSQWNGLAVTRWKPDPSEDRWGSFIYLRDAESGDWWSATTEPRRAPGEKARAFFSDDKAEFHKEVGTLRSQVAVIVGSEADAEGRRVTLFNDGPVDRIIEVTSYAEIVLTSEETDSAHPLFSKMFVRTEVSEDGASIHAVRNKRKPDEPDMYLAAVISDSSNGGETTSAETDRRKFLGRGRSVSDPAALDAAGPLSGTDGYTLDPVFALRRTVRVPAGKSARLNFWTIAAPSRAEAELAVSRCRNGETFDHEAQLAWTRSQVQQFHVGISSQEAAAFQQIARYLTYPDTALRGREEAVRTGLNSQSALWPLSISGDFPIFVLRIDDDADLKIVRKALLMQEYLRSHNHLCDLVIVNERSTSYAQDLQQALDVMTENARARGRAKGPREHIFAVRRDLMSKETHAGLLAAAAVMMHTRNGDIVTQLERVVERQDSVEERGLVPAVNPVRALHDDAPDIDGSDLLAWNGFGGFADDGAYIVRLRAGTATPHPWINVISNEIFGFHTSSEGASFTWSSNSRDYQLTPWTNDTVVNRPGEGLYIAHLDGGSVSTPFAGLSRNRAARFEVRHEPGLSTFSSTDTRLDTKLEQTVHFEKPVKLQRLTLTNRQERTARLRVYAYAEWVLGNNPVKTRSHIVPEFTEASGALTATNPFSVAFAGRTAFMAADRRPSAFTASRREVIGSGSVEAPEAVLKAATLSGSTRITGDPCAALAYDIELAPGETKTLLLFMGDTESAADTAALIGSLEGLDFDAERARTTGEWTEFLDTVQVDTPEPTFDVMVNTWLPYQNLACRIRARSAFYQASGAFGFRDQLQDSLALLLQDPGIARAQILNAAGRQFREGDFQHWWLPRTGAGVRTMISDDVVWLGYGVSHYMETTGDETILEETVPFLEGPQLEPGQHDNFFQPETSEEVATVYEHTARALDLSIERTGEDGLPLFLGGDWNDGMNRVGEQGRGQSVWLGWFLLRTLERWIPLAKSRKDKRAKAWASHAKSLKEAIEGPGWDGDWYRRGTFDDGTPLGSVTQEECRIDSLGQSWSVLSGAGDKARSEQGMDAVLDQLVDDEHQIVRLFTPPFAETEQEPGYIKGYPPGVRENGGQYTHAATWVVYALAELGRVDDAWRCFQMLNPVQHSLTKEAAEHYRTEPYAIAADIYGREGKEGRGGWTWYTGSAGWLFRVGVEAILGIRKKGDSLEVNPKIPSHWPGYSVVLNIEGRRVVIDVQRKSGGGFAVKADGKATKGTISLK